MEKEKEKALDQRREKRNIKLKDQIANYTEVKIQKEKDKRQKELDKEEQEKIRKTLRDKYFSL